MAIDLNCDLGEIPALIADGTQEALMASVTSVNIACGGHAGDEHTMELTIRQALRHGVRIGAHPGYADRAHFGRLDSPLPAASISELVYQQVCTLDRIAARWQAPVVHVKAHGALYNQAAGDPVIADAIAAGVARWRRDVVLVGLAGSSMLHVFRAAGFRVAAEAFADRRYEADGTLRSRRFADALIHEPKRAAEQALSIAAEGSVVSAAGTRCAVQAATLCIHGDTPGAPAIAAAVVAALHDAGIAVQALG
jgi:5-oxoprolinase (ATP-hydrolysing) subunit A